MSKLTTFGIVLAENKQVYFPGEIVAGNLIIKLSAPMEIEGRQIITYKKRLFVDI